MRPSLAARMASALALPCFFSWRVSQALPRSRVADQEAGGLAEGPLQVGVADLLAADPFFLPADSCAQRTSRA